MEDQYRFPLDNYMSQEQFERIERFARTRKPLASSSIWT